MKQFIAAIVFSHFIALAQQTATQDRASPDQAALTQDLAHAQGTNLGIFTFTGHCATCHDSERDGAPDRYSLNRFTPEQVLESMNTGSMAPYARDLTELEKRVVAVYVSGRPIGSVKEGEASQMPNRCTNHEPMPNPAKGPAWNGWGYDLGNSRFQPTPGLRADQVPLLKLKWAFGFPNANSVYGQPTVVSGRVFVAADTGFVYSLDAGTGCVHWSFRANAGVRTAVSIGAGVSPVNYLAYFGDIKGNVYAVNAATGVQVWMQRADKHPVARITGAPKLEGGILYVPVASLEESGGGNPKYPCCTFRGSVVAYDAKTGKQIWKSYTISEEPRPIKKTSIGTQLWGPAGAGVWSSPAIDLKRRALYVSTGNGYTEPAVETSDAVLAFDLDTGKRLWVKQLMSKDAYVRNCPGKYRPYVPTANKSETCPADLGPDMDFGNAPILRSMPDGRTLIFIGQKDGHAWALDPDKQGAVVWDHQLGPGLDGGGGGMMWGSAADERLGYFPLTRGGPAGGLTALGLKTGEQVWRADPPIPSMAPVTVIPGVVFAGSATGTIYAYSTNDGHVLWNFNTNKEFTTVNGVAAKGGNMGGSGPVVSGGMLFVPSGYADLFGGKARGNVLLAFSPN